MSEINRALEGVTKYEPDLTLLTSDEGSPVYMRRWWLQRTLADDGHGQDGLYVHRFEKQRPGRFPQPPVAVGLAGAVRRAPSSKTRSTEPR